VEHWCGGRCSGAGHLATVCPIAIIGFRHAGVPDRYICHKLSHLPFCGTHGAAEVLQTKGQTLNLFW
jgi:hypothetical protein